MKLFLVSLYVNLEDFGENLEYYWYFWRMGNLFESLDENCFWGFNLWLIFSWFVGESYESLNSD